LKGKGERKKKKKGQAFSNFKDWGSKKNLRGFKGEKSRGTFKSEKALKRGMKDGHYLSGS